MQYSRKELRDDRKTEHFSSVQQRTETIDAIFIPQITDMHGIPFEENSPEDVAKDGKSTLTSEMEPIGFYLLTIWQRSQYLI